MTQPKIFFSWNQTEKDSSSLRIIQVIVTLHLLTLSKKERLHIPNQKSALFIFASHILKIEYYLLSKAHT